MAPKAAMKTAMKAPTKAVMKAVMKVKASSSSKDLLQGPTPAEKSKMTKKALQSLGKFSLEDKVQKAIESTSTPEEAAAALKASLTKVEHSKVWGQHNTYLKNNPDADAAAESSKKDKGLSAALWFIQDKGNKFLNLTHKVSGTIAVNRLDKWVSMKEMLDRFGQEDFDAHVASGRIIWREDPMTRGTYEYKDQNAVERVTTTSKDKTLTRGQEAVLDNDVDKMFEDLFNQELQCQ